MALSLEPIEGPLPVADLEAGTSGQLLITGADAIAAWLSVSGDVSLSPAGVLTVNGLSGASPASITPATLRWLSTVVAPTLTQADTTGATGAAMAIVGQSTTATTGTATGGSLTIMAGAATGAGAANVGGDLYVMSGNAANGSSNIFGTLHLGQYNVDMATLGFAGFQRSTRNTAVTGGTTTLSRTVYRYPSLSFSGTLTSNLTIVFPTQSGGEWVVDCTQVVLGAFTITLRANSVNWGTTVGNTNLYRVFYAATTGKLYGSAMTP